MAQTAFTTSDAATVKLWEQKHLFLEPIKQSFFANKMSETGDNFVYTNNKFTKEQGDRITFALIPLLNDTWVTSGQTLEGSEEALNKYTYNLTLEEYAAAVRDRGPLDRQRAMFSIDNVSQERLKKKIATKIDQLLFDAIDSSATKIFYKISTGVTSTATLATAKSALTLADSKITPAMVSAVKAWASTGGNRGQIPFEPVMSKGRSVYGLITYPDTLYDWKQDSTWSQAAREAEVRGKDNPLFTGVVGIWDGCAIWENEKCPIVTDAGAGGDVAASRAYFMGAGALAWAWGKKPELTPETFDYKRQHGYGVSMICAAGKTQFNSKDFGCVSLYLSRTNLAGL